MIFLGLVNDASYKHAKSDFNFLYIIDYTKMKKKLVYFLYLKVCIFRSTQFSFLPSPEYKLFQNEVLHDCICRMHYRLHPELF